MAGRFTRGRDRSQETTVLREAWERSELFVHAAPAFLVVLDREQRVRLINAHGCRVLGYAESELLGRNWYDTVVAPRDRERLRAGFVDIMTGAADLTEEVESTLLARSARSRGAHADP